MALTQANRPLRVTSPLGPDKLLLVGLTGTEALSQLFQFQLSLLAENATKVEFDKLIGAPISVELDLPERKKRFFHGICSRLAEGRRDTQFTRYSMEIVPQFWLLTRRVQSRIFQQITVPDILKEVLKGLDVKWDIQGSFFERDYCVQYRESDFNFASRLMEEEGIYYYFTHNDKGSKLVVANTPQCHTDVPEFPKCIYDEARNTNRDELRVNDWEKVQELRSGKVTLWDHCFELPQQNLEAQKTIQETVAVGKVTHKLKVADNDKLELYDYPGAYAQRFDGIDPGGGARAGDLEKIFQDNGRVAKLHVEREATESLDIHGTSNCAQFTAGHKFTLERHFNADGPYVLTRVQHSAKLGADYRSGGGDVCTYENQFQCIPLALPYRPPLTTPKPSVGGTQTATVVGPAGEAIFCDKYGRIKIQFHWDRQGKKDAKSSCWVRVSQTWGGANWGGMFIPHVGQEVIVDFEEGDPDSPLIVGRVYNAEAMPPLELPANKTQSIVRDHGGNQIKLQGEKGQEQIKLYSPFSETTFVIGAPGSLGDGFAAWTNTHWRAFAGGNYEWEVKGNSTTQVFGFYLQHVVGFQEETTLGGKIESVVGGLASISTPFILEWAKGWKWERSPKIIEMAGSIKAEIDDRVIEKINSEVSKINKDLEKIGKQITVVTSDLTEKIATAKREVTGALKEKLGPVERKIASMEDNITGSLKALAGSITLESKGGMTLKSKGSTFMKNPQTYFDGHVQVTKDVTILGNTLGFGRGVFVAKK